MNNIRFEWDKNKNLININKHKISFEEAKLFSLMKMQELSQIPNILGLKRDLLFWEFQTSYCCSCL